MRDTSGPSGRRWVGSGLDEARSKEAVTDAPWTPVEPDEQPARAWWADLTFDSRGTRVPYNGSEWTAEDLSRTDAVYAEVAAGFLADRKEPADINNWACASIFAARDRTKAAGERLEAIAGNHDIAKRNLRLIREHAG